MQVRIDRNTKMGLGNDMNEMARPLRVPDAQGDRLEVTIPAVESAALLQGRRELVIRHGAVMYRLRLTASNKLILTK
jgi:hemin uptake protein HemP